jgi:hypothetical protein
VSLIGAENVVCLRIRDGEVAEAGSWVYAWLQVDTDRPVVYVGATGLQPGTRTWLHLHDPDPDVGRIAARYPEAMKEPLDVVAVLVPDGVSRQDTKIALTARLAEVGLLSERYVGDPPAETVSGSPDVGRQVERIVTLIRQHNGTLGL